MFIGHFGVGLGAKKAAPKISLGTFFLASQFLDLLWPTFLLLGWEHVKIQPGMTKMTPLNFTDYPLSHSLLMAVVWGMLFAMVYFLIKRNYFGSLVLGLCVLSHWVLDLFVHIHDLPLFPGSNYYFGFGLWNNKLIAIALEGLIFMVGLALYINSTMSKNKAGTYGLWGLMIVLVLIYLSSLFGPPPPSVKAIAWAGELQWIFVFWAYWVDKNRVAIDKTNFVKATLDKKWQRD